MLVASPFSQRKGGRYPVRLLLILLLLLLLSGCDSEDVDSLSPTYSATPVNSKPVYLFGIHPLHNPDRLHAIFGPLMDYLNQHIDNAEFRLEASRSYAQYDEKLFSAKYPFSLGNPYQTVKSLEHGYRVFAKMGEDDRFRGIILVRKDSHIERINDLKGKSISYPAPTALAASMMPQYFLHQQGLDVFKDLNTIHVGSLESSIMSVYLGQTDAAGTWLVAWQRFAKERPAVANELVVRWQTDPLPNNGLVVRQDVPDALVTQVTDLLVDLQNHKEGQRILARMEICCIEKANNATYQPVAAFIERFSREVRDPQQPD